MYLSLQLYKIKYLEINHFRAILFDIIKHFCQSESLRDFKRRRILAHSTMKETSMVFHAIILTIFKETSENVQG